MAGDEWKERTFKVSREALYSAMLEVAAADFNVRQTDKDSCVVTFSTGMSMKTWKGHDVSAVCVEQPDGSSKVVLHDQTRGGQLVTWGAGKGARKKFLEKLTKKLADSPGPKPTAATPAEAPAPTPEPSPTP